MTVNQTPRSFPLEGRRSSLRDGQNSRAALSASHIKRAELVEGVVCIGMPVRSRYGQPMGDSLLGWSVYRQLTPGS